METMVLYTVLIMCGLIVVLVGRVLYWSWFRPKRLERLLRKQGLNGSSYKFVVGDMKEMSELRNKALSTPIAISDDHAPRVLSFLDKSIKLYGKNSFMWMGPTPRVQILDPNLLKELMNRIDAYQKDSMNPYLQLLVTGLVTYEDDQWAKHRKIINPAFHQEKLKRMFPAFHSSCSEMVNEWEKMVSVEGSCELDVWPCLENLTADVISRTAFGSSYEEGRKVFELHKELEELVMTGFTSVYIPGRRSLPTKRNKRMKVIDTEVKALLGGIIRKREKAIKEGEVCNDDLLGMLLESNYKEIREHENNKNVGMSFEEVIEECKLFYFAGQETTSVLLVWTMIMLSKHTIWQERAREEVLQIFGKNKVDNDGLSCLKIVNMILHEVLRLYPPVALLTRKVVKDVQLGEMCLPGGTLISVPILLIHHDRDHWGDDAKEFKPERFAEGVAKATNGQVSFMPFAWGPRICIGQNFAMTEAKIALSMILQNFSFELSASYTHAPFTLVTVQPQYGAHLLLHKL